MGLKRKKSAIIPAINYLSAKYDFRYNEITGVTDWKKKGDSKWKIMDDYDLNSLVLELEKQKITVPVGNLRNVLKSEFVQKYNPFIEYFYRLPEWSPNLPDYIGMLADTVKTTNDDLWKMYLKKWIVAMVACALDERVVNHTMIVFYGEQGIGKTTWSLKLLPFELQEYCYSGMIDPGNKDTMIFLAEKLLINVDELEILGRNQLGGLKQLITKDSIKIRRPYGFINENLQRRASFIASVNNKEFLTDLTGNRRFLCVEVIDKINTSHEISVDDVYAQAMYLWQNEFQYWFDGDETRIINNNNEQFRSKSLEEELLLKIYLPANSPEDADEAKTTSEILAIIFENNRNQINNATKNRLGKILRAKHFQTRKREGRQLYLLKRQPVPTYGYPT